MLRFVVLTHHYRKWQRGTVATLQWEPACLATCHGRQIWVRGKSLSRRDDDEMRVTGIGWEEIPSLGREAIPEH